MNEWAPVVNEMHTSKHGLVHHFISEVVNVTNTMRYCTSIFYCVLQSAIYILGNSDDNLKSGTRKGDEVISLYMPLLVGHQSDEVRDKMEEIKKAVVEIGGRKNVFTTRNTDEVCCSQKSTVWRGVLQIPRFSEFADLSTQLDRGEYKRSTKITAII